MSLIRRCRMDLKRMLNLRAEVVGNLYTRFRDPHLLKKWAVNLIDSVKFSSVKDKIDFDKLQVAKRNLEKLLESDPLDHQATWNLGKVYYLLLNCDHGRKYPDKMAIDYADASLKCFKQAQAEAPGVYKDQKWIDLASRILKCRRDNPSLPRAALRDALRKEVGGMSTACERATYDAEIRKGDNFRPGTEEYAQACEARRRYRYVQPIYVSNARSTNGMRYLPPGFD